MHGHRVINMSVCAVGCEVSRHWTGDLYPVNCVPEETLMWVSGPVLGPNLYSPSGLIAPLGLIIQTWLNTKHETPPFLSLPPPPPFLLSLSLFSKHIQSVSLPAPFMFLPTQHSALPLFRILSPFRLTYSNSLLVFLREREGGGGTDWPLQGPKAWGNPGRIVGLLCPTSRGFLQLHVGK